VVAIQLLYIKIAWTPGNQIQDYCLCDHWLHLVHGNTEGQGKMKDKQYNREIGATAGCTLCMLEASHDDGLPHGLKGDAWFGSVWAAMSVAPKGHEEVFQVKWNKGLCPKDYIEKALEDALVGVKTVLSGIAPHGIPLIALGCHYSRKTALLFVMTSKTGNTTAGNSYIMTYTDCFGNLC
jgi:hypothetical protein